VAQAELSRGRALAAWAIGALPVVAVVVWFKLSIAPASDLIQPASAFFAKLVDPSRHLLVARAVIRAVGWWWLAAGAAWVMSAVLISRRWRPAGVRALSVVMLMAGGYYIVYVTTPHDVDWHVSTSLSRLLAQLWPSAVLALVLTSAVASSLPTLTGEVQRVELGQATAP
jgi:hypothetical protein